jgi:two-component system nitrogen regulation response regulator NtrX
VNSRDNNFTKGKMDRRLAQIEESVARYLSQLDTADRQTSAGEDPSEVLAARTTRLKEKLAKLEEEVKRGTFREDLWFRLNVVPIHLPPLRERREDIPALVQHFTEFYCQENGFRRKTFAPEALEKLSQYPWPGNIRELRNMVERLVIMTPGDPITAADLPLPLQAPAAKGLGSFQAGVTLREIRDRLEKDYILSCLEATGGNMSQAAELLGLERSNLYKKIRALGIESKS